jgi:hypothetical protein
MASSNKLIQGNRSRGQGFSLFKKSDETSCERLVLNAHGNIMEENLRWSYVVQKCV